MVTVAWSARFEKSVRKIHDAALKERVKVQIGKIVSNPLAGKPMRYCRKNTREVYVSPFRLSYHYDPGEERIIFLALYHKDEQ